MENAFVLYLGLGKTLYNSSACLIENTGHGLDAELVLSERLLRKKAAGVWPEKAIRHLEQRWQNHDLQIAENRDVISPLQREENMDHAMPFFQYLQSSSLQNFSRRFNPDIKYITHHLCHAAAATAISPFESAVIVVIDGAGSAIEEFGVEETQFATIPELGDANALKGTHEECSIYLMNHGRLQCVFKRWRQFQKSKSQPALTFSSGAGIFYESAAKYIFNSERASGKVMGLAPFAKGQALQDRISYLEKLDWKKSFQGKTRQDWDQSPHDRLYTQVAADTQMSFEEDMEAIVQAIRRHWPEYDNLILTGGCALNCTFNGKLIQRGLFSEVYVPPFPGDESIGFGAAAHMYLQNHEWQPMLHENQHGYFGPRSSAPDDLAIENLFRDFKITKPSSITQFAAERLARGEVLAWFQGRSESGPRALGHRSILVHPGIPGVKEKLNREIKFRESFRPYGSSCLAEAVHEYFDVPVGFNNPYMSFAVQTRPEYKKLLAEVTHVDGTSRMQTVRRGQCPKFYELIQAFGERTGLFCILNTSLNVMGEPIVETLEDAMNFLQKTPVDGLVIGDYFIHRPKDEA